MATETVSVPISEVEPGTPFLIDKTIVDNSQGYVKEDKNGQAAFLQSMTEMQGGRVTARFVTGKDFNECLFTHVGKDKVLKVVKGSLEKKTVVAIKKRFEKAIYPANAPFAMSVGSDPELFMGHENGEVIPAWEYLGEKKEEKGIFWDGFQAEFVTAPAQCLVVHTDSLQGGLNLVIKAARKKFPKARVLNHSTVPVSLHTLAELPQKYVEFGCKPSMNVYGEPPVVVPDARALGVRFAGGHIHFGINFLPAPMMRQIVYALDGVCGVAATAMAQNLDDPVRRLYYGRAGEIRRPKHGLEYRVLSNFWLHHPAIAHLTYEIARAAVRFGASGWYKLFWKTPQDEVRRIINECDGKAAARSIAVNGELFKNLFGQMNFYRGHQTYCYDWAIKAIDKGIEAVLPSRDIAKNWSPTYCINDASISEAGGYTWSLLSEQLSKGTVQPA